MISHQYAKYLTAYFRNCMAITLVPLYPIALHLCFHVHGEINGEKLAKLLAFHL